MKEKGFTLIELLAVIVILAIIAVIATPMVLNTIEDARKGAANSSAYSYIEEVETEIAKYMLDNNGTRYSAGKYDIATLSTDLGVEVKGDAPTEGYLCIGSNGTITKASLKINNYVVSYDGKETTTTDLDTVEDISCDGTSEEVTYQEYYTGTKTQVSTIYYNPETNTKCTEAEAVSTTGTKTGCMKWYAIENSDSSKSTVDVILDHNTTTATVAWNSSGNNEDGMNEVATALTTDTSTWISGLNPRLITADEVAQITGNTTFNAATSTTDAWFYFDSNSQTQTATAQGESNYTWLFDYTNGCTSYGCNVADSSTKGYGTSDSVVGRSDIDWFVNSYGYLTYFYVDTLSAYGVRPVITISKSIIS